MSEPEDLTPMPRIAGRKPPPAPSNGDARGHADVGRRRPAKRPVRREDEGEGEGEGGSGSGSGKETSTAPQSVAVAAGPVAERSS